LLTDVIDSADVGVIQGRGSLCFATEAQQGLRIFGDVLRQELEGDETMESRVLSLVHHSHSTTTKFLNDSVVRDGLTDHWREILRESNGQVNECRQAERHPNRIFPRTSPDSTVTRRVVGHTEEI
jgi:hypothetical protein